MEYTGISKEKEEFVPRKSKEEFLRDGEVIGELYNRTEDFLRREHIADYRGGTMVVFNHAYRICWMIVGEKAAFKQINDFIMPKGEIIRNHSMAVAYALFRLNEGFYPFSHRTFFNLVKVLPHSFYARCYADLVKGKGLSHPIDFRGSLLESNQESEIDFVQAKSNIIAALDEAIGLKDENKELRFMLGAQESMREEYERKAKILQQKLDVWENNVFYKAVNINTILKYAQDPSICDSVDMKAIQRMLLILCDDKDKETKEKIKTMKLGGNIVIEYVENLNPSATKVETNHYHNKE